MMTIIRSCLLLITFSTILSAQATTIKLPNADSKSSFNITKSDDTKILEVKGDGTIVGDGSNLSGVVTSESDPQVGANTTNYIPYWDGSALSKGTVYDNGKIGIGTSSPDALLELYNAAGSSIRLSGHVIHTQSMGSIEFYNTYWSQINLRAAINGVVNSSQGLTGELVFSTAAADVTPNEKMRIDKDGNVRIGTPTPSGKLDVNGAIYKRGASLHADYVFMEDYYLESIDEHASFMWSNKHLPAVPKASKDENGNDILEVGGHRKGMLEELEKAHLYI